MKTKYLILFVTAVFFLEVSKPTTVLAQTPTPPAATGVVTGKIVNKNKNAIVTESLDLMLHTWDEKYNDLNMEHGQSQADGTFRFTGVDLKPGQQYGVMAIYDGVIYVSETAPAKTGSDFLDFTVPVYETTKDLSAVQVDQMHVLWNFASDGLETTEVYILSNKGERTVKDAITMEDGKMATLLFPLPDDADFIFFQPDQKDRFIKFPGGFADTNPLMLGEGSGQITVKYLTPFRENLVFTYTAPVDIHTINFLLPENTGVDLHGEGLSSPTLTNLDNGKAFFVYTVADIKAGQTVEVTFSGTPNLVVEKTSGKTQLPLVLGGIFLGLAMIGTGFWWWRTRDQDDDSEEGSDFEPRSGERTLDGLIAEIAFLDEAFERGELNEEEYQQSRKDLRQQAKNVMDLQKDIPARGE